MPPHGNTGSVRRPLVGPRLIRRAIKPRSPRLVHTLNVSAGTLNPHLPKRTIAPAQIPGLRFGTLMAALNRQFFLNKPYGVGGKNDNIP
jgi:hypothetical protein